MTQFMVDIKGNAAAKLAEIRARLQNPEPLMAGIAAEMLSLTEEAFEREGEVGGDKWDRLAPSTIKQRKKAGHWPGKKLQRSPGGLAPSVQPFHDASRAGLTVSKPYAAIHQLGGKAGRGQKVTIPARGYMPVRKEGSDLDLTPTGQSALLKMMADFVEGGI